MNATSQCELRWILVPLPKEGMPLNSDASSPRTGLERPCPAFTGRDSSSKVHSVCLPASGGLAVHGLFFPLGQEEELAGKRTTRRRETNPQMLRSHAPGAPSSGSRQKSCAVLTVHHVTARSHDQMPTPVPIGKAVVFLGTSAASPFLVFL